MLNPLNLINFYRRYYKALDITKNIFSEYITNFHPELTKMYRNWCDSKQINAVVFTQITAEDLCNIEDIPFNEEKRQISVFAGAVGKMSDDLLDYGKMGPEEFLFYLKGKEFDTQNSEFRKLLYAFGCRFRELLPPNFESEFSHVINEFAQAQIDNLKLREDVNHDEILSIKHRTGGYSALLLYSLVCPDFGDVSRNLRPLYDPQNNIMPTSKAGAIFNMGAWLSRVDDLIDAKIDRERYNIKQLATEGYINWDGVKKEIDYVYSGLERFYSREKLKSMMELAQTTYDYEVILRHFYTLRERIVNRN